MTWSDLLRDAQTRLLGGMPAETAANMRQEARQLLSWISEKSIAWLQAHGDEEACADIASAFLHAADRRAGREPMAYITGHAGFYGHDFEVGPATLIPRPDTELLVEKVSLFLDGMSDEMCAHDAVSKSNDLSLPFSPRPCRVLDVGTGSGCIPISLVLEHPLLQAVSIDISPDALRIAKRNADRLGVADRIDFRLADVLVEDSPGEWPLYDVIVSNPPYIPSADIPALMPEVACHEPKAALDGGPDGLLFYRRLLLLSCRLLRPGGLLAVEIGYDQGDAVPALFRKAGFVPQLFRDVGGQPRVVLGIRPD